MREEQTVAESDEEQELRDRGHVPPEEQGSAVDGLRRMASDASFDGLNDRLESQVEEKPLLRELLTFRVILLAGGIALVLGVIVKLLLSPLLAILVFVIAFPLAAYILAGYQAEQHQRAQNPPKTA